MYFDYFGSVDLLTSLVSGSLKQRNVLCQSVRCWVILTSLYGSGGDLNYEWTKVDAANPETANQWFSPANWINYVTLTKPNLDSLGNCQELTLSYSEFGKISLQEWLFTNDEEKQKWMISFRDRYQVSLENIDDLLLSSKNPFRVDRRTLSNDFCRLSERKWLNKKILKVIAQKRINKKTGEEKEIKREEYEYQKNDEWFRLIPNSIKIFHKKLGSSKETFSNDIHQFFDNFAQPINGKQRFFIDVEYVVPSKESENIEALQKKLKNIWSNEPVPPLKLTYRSAKLFQEEVECIVYPVCFYYLLRAPYLFAYGQFPKGNSKINWYDYRIDRIIDINILDWEKHEQYIPSELLYKFKENDLPDSSIVKDSIDEALGYDFYQPQEIMYVRFDRYFHDHYIQGTERDLLFRRVSIDKIKFKVGQANLNSEYKHNLLQKLEQYPKDIYCEVPYYKDDNNVVMRLRAWGAKVEVILPWELRQRIIKDFKDLQRTYQ